MLNSFLIPVIISFVSILFSRLSRLGQSITIKRARNTYNRTLKKNRDILRSACPTGRQKVKKAKLLQQGFRYGYFTGQYETKQGHIYYYCYDYQVCSMKRICSWSSSSMMCRIIWITSSEKNQNRTGIPSAQRKGLSLRGGNQKSPVHHERR